MTAAPDPKRQPARALAHAAIERGEPLAWFEELYAGASGEEAIPWADLVPNPLLTSWLEGRRFSGRALKVGCGLGDDAEALASLGLEVVAFDISPTAVDWCRRRFPDSRVEYVVADALEPPDEWTAAFDFVLECYTLQVLPPELRRPAAARIEATVAPGGTLLAIARGREDTDPPGQMPWPLTPDELKGCFSLERVSFEDLLDDEDPPVRRLRMELRRPLVEQRLERDQRPANGADGSGVDERPDDRLPRET